MLVEATDTIPLAPIVLFVYNRLDHVQKTINALVKNTLAAQSDLIIYSDAAKNPLAEVAVTKVREYLKTVSGFKKVTIVERIKNWGLANSIIDGVSHVVNEYGKVIVLEDDIVTAPDFLAFMNNGLNAYEQDKKVWQITGWNFPVAIPNEKPVFFSTMINCWGWATWQDRWLHFNKEPERLVKTWDKKLIKKFNLDGSYNYWGQVLLNYEGKINSWAVFWYATIFEHQGLSLNPSISYVTNVGFDGSGENCTEDQNLTGSLNTVLVEVTHIDVAESPLAKKVINKYLRKLKGPLHKRITNKIYRILKN